MRSYRAFVVNKDGHFKKAVVLNCADDAVAVQEAKKVDGKYVELWEMERRVANLKNESAGDEFRVKVASTPVCAQCGREMRLKRVEPDVKTDKEIQTYGCPRCGLADRVEAKQEYAASAADGAPNVNHRRTMDYKPSWQAGLRMRG